MACALPNSPPAIPKPVLRRSEPAPHGVLVRNVERPMEIAARIGRASTLQSTRLRRLSPFALAVIAALVAALTTAVLLFAVTHVPRKPAPTSLGR